METLQVARAEGIVTITLDRPAKKNAMNDQMWDELLATFREIADSSDDRVVVMDRFNVRNLSAADLGELPELVVSDLSFISLRTVMPALCSVSTPDADLLLMVKPQFEVGKERLGKGGVVRSPLLRAEAVTGVAAAAWLQGFGCAGVAASPLPGPSGNVEYFLWLRRDCPPIGEDDVERAVRGGPQ